MNDSLNPVSPASLALYIDGRQRSVRGLGEPNLPRMYSAAERAERWDLISSLRLHVAAQSEPRLPLWLFFGESAHDKIARKRPTLEGRRFWEHFPQGAFPAGDATAASVPGIQAHDVYEARLSRLCLLHTLVDVAEEVLADVRRADCDWESLDYLPGIYPYSARAWEPITLGEATYEVAMGLGERMRRDEPELFTCIADRMVFTFAAEQHLRQLLSIGIDPPKQGLEEVLLDDADFLLLFDPAWDGIEDDALAVAADLNIAGPYAWFGEEMYAEVKSQLAT